MNNEIIYLDHAAATPVSESVLTAMLPYFSEKFYNPSAPYLPALEVRRKYEDAKSQIAKYIGAKGDEVVITAGATESINLAFSAASLIKDGEILVGQFEHHSVLGAAEKFGKKKLISVKKSGVIDLEDLQKKITPNTTIVSVMLANNETGVIQPISKIAAIIKNERLSRLKSGNKKPIYLHSDASQGVGQLDVHVSRLGVDLLTLNAGKIYGPKQVGLLWAERGIDLQAQVVGGGQERNLRSGTENVPGAIGFARAMTIAEKHRKSENIRLQELKKILKDSLLESFADDIVFIGESKKQLNSHISISFPGIDAERIVFALEMNGVMVATGSACAANKGTRSQTLVSMGLSDTEIDGSLRISLGKLSNPENTKKAASLIIDTIKNEQKRLRG